MPHFKPEVIMEKAKLICVIAAVLLAGVGIAVFVRYGVAEIKQDYFEGTVIENQNNCLTVQIDPSYESLTSALGETVKIENKVIVQNCDFSKFSPKESVRVLYSEVNAKEKRIEHIFAVYLLKEIQ